MFMGRLQPPEVAHVHGQVSYSVYRLLADSVKGSYNHKSVVEKSKHLFCEVFMSLYGKQDGCNYPSAGEHLSDTSAS